jgi:D-alanyl-D-alanine carboxypeptidase
MPAGRWSSFLAVGLALGACSACSRGAAKKVPPPMPASPPSSPVPSVVDLTPVLEPVRASGALPALAAAVFRGPEVVAIGATGLQHAGGDARVSTDAQWHLGSDTKAMTAVLVARAIDGGKLHFEDTLGTLLGAGTKVSAGFAGVTVEDLLRHRAGFSAELPAGGMNLMRREAADPSALTHIVARILAQQPAHPRGTFEYSNSSYMVLGAILERVEGRKWEELITTDLFVRLEMTRCGFGAPGGDSPWGHLKDGDALTPVEPGPDADNPPALGPAGRVHCSLADWGKFLAVILAGARGEPTPLVSTATMKWLLTPPEDAAPSERYAGGWAFLDRPWAGGTALSHSGSNTMWMATAWLAPAKNLAFVATTNAFKPHELDAAFKPLIDSYAR